MVPLGLMVANGSTRAGALTPLCFYESPTIVGTALDDRIVGTAGDDVIVGLSGDDTIFGKAGNDLICGDVGNDELRGGGQWGDRLDGGLGDDVLRDAAGVLAGDGDDVVVGAYQALGGDGNDRLVAGDVRRSVKLSGEGGDDVLIGSDVLGEEPMDELSGGPGDDVIRAGRGNDLVSPGEGSDKVWGGKDRFGNFIMFGDLSYRLRIDVARATATGRPEPINALAPTPPLETDRFWNMHLVHGSTHDDVMFGGPRGDALRGCGGNDRLYGRGGDDLLEGYTLASQSEWCPGENATDILDGGRGRDSCILGDVFRRCEGTWRS